MSTKATIELSIQDKASGVLKNVGQEFLNTAKLARQLGNVTDAKALEAAARHVGSVSSNLKAAEKDARRTTSGLKEATSAMKSFGSALPGGGTAGNLLGLNGVVAFAATAGAIVANSIRLAAEYNRISQVSTYSLTSNASMLASNLAAFKAKAIGMADLGIGAGSGARMIAGYGMASGLDGSIASANGRVLGTWAKAYGQDPGTFGQQMGLVSQYAGSNVNGSASAIFGAASVSGDAGRRVSEFIGVATSVLQQVSASHAGGNVDVRDALREITGITRLGGYFQTSQGLATTIGGMNQFGNNVVGNPLMQRIARQAGWSLEDMILGNHDTKHVASMANTAYRIFGGDHAQIASFLKGSMGLGDDQARAVFEALIRTKGNILGNVPSADPSKRIDAFKGSTEGKIEQALANLENAQTKVGDGILTKVAPGIEKLTEGIDKLVDSSDGWFKGVLTLLGIIAAANIARTGIGMIRGGATMLRGIPALGNALRGMSVGGELAGGGLAELMAGLGIGAVPVIMAAQLGGTMNSQGVTNRIADLERAGVPHADAVAIAQASARTQVDHRLLAAVDFQESTFGRGLDRLGRGGDKHGWGHFQMDDRYHSWADTQHANRDLGYAAQAAAEQLAHGGLSGYNSSSAYRGLIAMRYRQLFGDNTPVPSSITQPRTHADHPFHPASTGVHNDGHIAPALPGGVVHRGTVTQGGDRYHVTITRQPGSGSGLHRSGAYH